VGYYNSKINHYPFIFKGLQPLKMAAPRWTASGVAFGDTLLAGEGLGRGGINGFTSYG